MNNRHLRAKAVTPSTLSSVTPLPMSKRVSSRPASVPQPYLRAGSKVWQVKVKVPKSAGGPGQIARSLETKDRAEAVRRTPVVVAEIRVEIEARRRALKAASEASTAPQVPPVGELKSWWAERRVPDPVKVGRFVIPAELEPEWDATLEGILGDPVNAEDGRSAPRYAPDREAAVETLVGLTTGSRVPVGDELDRYLAQEGLKASYASRTKSAVRRLGEWLGDRPSGDDLNAVSGRVADEFADWLSTGRSTATLNSLISALSAYWTWMRRRRLVEANPWRGQARKVVNRGLNADKRPFEDAEMVRLLSGPASATLHDMMRIGALSGMRLTEIGNLRISDVENDAFFIRQSKTKAGIRAVPVHPDLKALVARRTAGKQPTDYLLEELTAPPSRQQRRGGKVGEWFTAYRRDLEMDARREGRRQSDTDFHSFRRWFVTQAERAGNRESLIQAVVGHKRPGVTLGTYSGGPSIQQHKAVVSSVRLPEGAPIEPPAVQGEAVRGRRPKA